MRFGRNSQEENRDANKKQDYVEILERSYWQNKQVLAYLVELDKKLNEEVVEYQADKSIEEMADILEVLFVICKARGHSVEELMQVRETKNAARGGFEERIYWKGNEEDIVLRWNK